MSGRAYQRGKQSGAAGRMRRLRARRRIGSLCFRGDVPREVIDALIRKGWLKADEATDPKRVGAAMVDVSVCWAHGTLVADTCCAPSIKSAGFPPL